MKDWVVLAAWLIASAYAGVGLFYGAYVYDSASSQAPAAQGKPARYQSGELIFRDEQSLRDYLQETEATAMFPWIFHVPKVLLPWSIAAAFGVLGGSTRLVKNALQTPGKTGTSTLVLAPLLSAVIGVMVHLIAMLIPSALAKSVGPTRTESIAGISLLGGLFTDQALVWLEQQAKKLFGTSTASVATLPAPGTPPPPVPVSGSSAPPAPVPPPANSGNLV